MWREMDEYNTEWLMALASLPNAPTVPDDITDRLTRVYLERYLDQYANGDAAVVIAEARKPWHKRGRVWHPDQVVTRPAVRYPGGKWRLAPWIIEHFPPHDCYVEPFGGGASVLLQKIPATYEVYNDLGSEVVTFFRVLRDRPADLVRAISLTPWSREEYELAAETTDDPVEQARRFAVRCWQSHAGGGLTVWATGWRYQIRKGSNRPAVYSWGEMDHLMGIAARLKEVQIERQPALDVIRRFDSPQTLFYLDPPYVWDTRGKWAGKLYSHEMTDDDHRALAEALHEIAGYAIISGYSSDLYTELYADWPRVERATRTNFTNVRTETLWRSPRVVAAVEAARSFGPLFDRAAVPSL